ncbi:hypothetical protein, partial [Pseudomaricurvus alcaniphilus]|uniref:hypothetical protein n=1 Tax=Pseudomaricurvus alcaniphilus TaxID=1166482 RepID=UPI001A9E30E3
LPPANMFLDTGSTPVDGADKTDAALPMAHLLTPESATSTHYFWAAASEKFQSSEQFRHMVYGAIDQAFKNEDEPMVAAVAARMKGRDLLDMSPVLLPMDAAAMRARRTLQKLINDESSG